MLKKLWRWLFGGCDHVWVDEGHRDFYNCRMFYQKCKTCGAHRSIEL